MAIHDAGEERNKNLEDTNPRAVIGNNAAPMGLDEARSRLETSGFMLARLETLAMAIRDDRIDRGCLKVLVELIDSMNRETWTSWLGREAIADRTGVSIKTAGNCIYQLKALGYIVGEKRETPQAGNRVLMHYTLSALSPEEIDAAISRAIGSIRGNIDTITHIKTARHRGQSVEKVPAIEGTIRESACHDGQEMPAIEGTSEKVPAIEGSFVPAIEGKSQNSPKSARYSGCSISKEESNKTNRAPTAPAEAVEIEGRSAERPTPKRGTRLTADWVLPKSWGEWALASCVITEAQIRREAENFRDFWIAKPGAGGVKLDWPATWRNWIRRNYRDKGDDAAPLPGKQHQPSAIDLILDAGRPKFGGGVL